jgi:hypothetical protein
MWMRLDWMIMELVRPTSKKVKEGIMGNVLGCLIIFVGSTIIYFVPTIVALSVGSINVLAIGLLNIFLGWTIIGWVVALVWAVMK